MGNVIEMTTHRISVSDRDLITAGERGRTRSRDCMHSHLGNGVDVPVANTFP